jgi:putative hydrolase of the HAD superfamily
MMIDISKGVQGNMVYRAVIFDLFGTLVHQFTSSGYEESLRQMAEAVGVDGEAFRRAWVHDTWRERATGQLPTVEAAVDHISRMQGVRPTAQQLATAAHIRYTFTRTTLRPRDDAVPTLQAIKAEGLSLGLISDSTPEVPDLWPETPFAPLIDVPVFSCSVGTKKPAPDIYGMACVRLGVEPQQCIYVGDGSSQELQGAASLGMYAVLLAPPGEERTDTRDWEGASWAGARIARLSDVMDFITGAA